MKARLMVVLGLMVVAASPGPVRANGTGPPEDLLATYEPSYADTRTQVTLEQGELPDSIAEGSADATLRGVIDLHASTGGWAGAGKTPPSARAIGAVIAPPFDWAGNQLRVEATFSYRLEIAEAGAVEVRSSPNDEDWLRASVSAGFEGDTPWKIPYEGWGAGEGSGSTLELGSSGKTFVSGIGTANTYVRAPCDGTTLSPFVQAGLTIDPDAPLIGSRERDARLTVYVSQIKVFRDTVMPCYHIADIAVLDNSFAPANVTVQVNQNFRFNYGQAQNIHDVFIPWFGSPRDGDVIDAYFRGTTTYYCRIHGTPDGQGMAGTITVT